MCGYKRQGTKIKAQRPKRGRIVFHSGRKGLTKWLATKNNLKRVIMVGGTRDTENNKGKHVWRLVGVKRDECMRRTPTEPAMHSRQI